MENPATWGLAERTVGEALKKHRLDREHGVVGLSLSRTITDALRDVGLLVPEDVPEQDTSRCLYGCASPSSCEYQHLGCAHCRRHRTGIVGVSHSHE